VIVTIDPPKFLVFCRYHDCDTDPDGMAYSHADTPFEAHIEHCQRFTGMPRWDCCNYLEECAWTGTVYRVTGPYSIEPVRWQDCRYPWNQISHLDREFKKLEKVLPTAVQLQELAEAIPDFQLGGIAVSALMQRMEAKQAELAELRAQWALQKTKPPEQESGREGRGIQLPETAKAQA
jgi:hypothetical protein